LLYQRIKFRYLGHTEYPVPFSNRQKKSRNILHVSGCISTHDTLDVFVCHFPSRYGGEKETEQSRKEAAIYLHTLCDSLNKIRTNGLLLIMGDFNDVPDGKVFTHWFKTESLSNKNEAIPVYYNLFATAKGSHKYRDTWSQLDQMIINARLSAIYSLKRQKCFRPHFC
jgi:endonuclease/exonuclease/phosphatase family metal-dependent hydrolase